MFPTKHGSLVFYVLILALYLIGAGGTSFYDEHASRKGNRNGAAKKRTRSCQYNNVFDGSGELIEPYTRYEDCSLITMANEQLTDAHAVKLAKALHKMKGLEALYLHYNKIGDEGFDAIATGIRGLNLYMVNFRKNLLGDPGMKALALSFQHMTRLTYINLSGNRIGNSAKNLRKALSKSALLQDLQLHGNKMDDEAILGVMDGLSNGETNKGYFRKLTIGGNPGMTQMGCLSLAQKVGKLVFLDTLGLSGIKIDKKCMAILSISLFKLKELLELYLNHCNLEEESLNVLGYSVSSQEKLNRLDIAGNPGILSNDEKLVKFGKHLVNSSTLHDVNMKGGLFSFDFLKRAFPSIFGESIAEKIENCARDWSRQNKACALLRNTPAGNSAMDL